MFILPEFECDKNMIHTPQSTLDPNGTKQKELFCKTTVCGNVRHSIGPVIGNATQKINYCDLRTKQELHNQPFLFPFQSAQRRLPVVLASLTRLENEVYLLVLPRIATNRKRLKCLQTYDT